MRNSHCFHFHNFPTTAAVTRHSACVMLNTYILTLPDTSEKEANGMKCNIPPISKFPSRKEWEDACWQAISKSAKLLYALTTAYERRNVVLRAAVTDRINAGESYRQIGKELWLSSQTISSIKKAVHARGYRSYRERGKSERKPKVYSRDLVQKKRRPPGRPVRTKYGTLYLP